MKKKRITQLCESEIAHSNGFLSCNTQYINYNSVLLFLYSSDMYASPHKNSKPCFFKQWDGYLTAWFLVIQLKKIGGFEEQSLPYSLVASERASSWKTTSSFQGILGYPSEVYGYFSCPYAIVWKENLKTFAFQGKGKGLATLKRVGGIRCHVKLFDDSHWLTEKRKERVPMGSIQNVSNDIWWCHTFQCSLTLKPETHYIHHSYVYKILATTTYSSIYQCTSSVLQIERWSMYVSTRFYIFELTVKANTHNMCQHKACPRYHP